MSSISTLAAHDKRVVSVKKVSLTSNADWWEDFTQSGLGFSQQLWTLMVICSVFKPSIGMGNQWDATPAQMMINGLVFEHASEKYESYCGWPFKGRRKTIIDFRPTTWFCFHPEGENTHTLSRQSCRAWVVITKSRCTSFKTHTDTQEEGYAYFLICLTKSNRGQVPPKTPSSPIPK